MEERAMVVLDYYFGEKLCSVGLPADILLGNNLGECNCQFPGSVTQRHSLGPEKKAGTELMQDTHSSSFFPVYYVRAHVTPAKSQKFQGASHGSQSRWRHTRRAHQPKCYSCRERGHIRSISSEGWHKFAAPQKYFF